MFLSWLFSTDVLHVLSGVAYTIVVYEACGRGVRLAGRRISAKISEAVRKELPLAFPVVTEALNGRYPLAKDIYPRLSKLEESVEALPDRVAACATQQALDELCQQCPRIESDDCPVGRRALLRRRHAPL